MSSSWRKSIPATERASLQILPLLGSLALLAAAAVSLYLVVHARGDRDGINILAGITFVGLALSLWQGFKFIALLQEGSALLVLQESPPAVGGHIKAFVQLSGSAAQATHAKVQFYCMRDGDSSTDAPNATAAGKLWSAQLDVPLKREGSAAVAALEFAIPATLPPTGKWDSGRDDDSGDDHVIGWQLRVSAGTGRNLVEHLFNVEVQQPRAPQAAQAPVEWLRDFAALALILANLVPVFMVLKGRADVASIAYLYWAENLVIAGYMFLRVLLAARGDVGDKVGGMFFFALWLGAVSIFLGMVLIGILLNPPRGWDQLTKEQFERGDSYFVHFAMLVLRTIGAHIVEAGLVIAVLSLVASHGVAFVQNYLRNGQYLQARVNQEVRHLMNRSFVTFGAIFVLGAVAGLGPPKYVLAGLVLAKTGFDLWRYAHEKRAGAAAAAGVS